ncbi:hypothetical protein [Endothiovibrio diazotrophicus]
MREGARNLDAALESAERLWMAGGRREAIDLFNRLSEDDRFLPGLEAHLRSAGMEAGVRVAGMAARALPTETRVVELLASLEARMGWGVRGASNTAFAAWLRGGGRPSLSAGEPLADRVYLVAPAAIRVREIKIARAIRHFGGRVVLLLSGGVSYALDEESFEGIYSFATLAEVGACLQEAVARHGPGVVHVFCSMEENEGINRLLSTTSLPVIGDFYDVIGEGYLIDRRGYWRHQAALERLWLAQVDGLCARSLEIQPMRRRGELSRHCPSILFPEYCWGDLPIERKPRSGGAIRVAVAGTLDSGEDPRHPDSIHWLIDLLDGCGVELHLFPAFDYRASEAQFRERFRGYLATCERSHHCTIHRTLPPRDYVPAMAGFDYGLHGLHHANDNYSSDSIRRVEKDLYSYGNRMVDYLDAGVTPIVHAAMKFCCRFARDAGAVCVDTGTLRSRAFWAGLQRPPAVPPAAAARLTLQANAGRLRAFYAKVVAHWRSRRDMAGAA